MLRIATALLLACSSTGLLAAGDNPLVAGEHRFANEPGPVEQWYRVAGKADGVPVVFLHGGPGEGSMAFAHGAGPELEKVARVVYYDQRGSGRSERPADPDLYSIPILVEDVEALRRELGVERIVLLGHSFGTVLALEYAAKYPDHSAGLILTGAVPDVPAAIDGLCDRLANEDAAAHQRALEAADPDGRCNPFAAFDDDARKAWIDAAMFPDPATARQVEAWDNEDGLGNSGEMGGALWNKGFLDYRFTATDRLTMPVLFIDGARDDQTAVEPQQALASAVPDGRVLSYEGAGHFMFVEQPRRFAKDVADFLADLGD